MKGPTKQIDFDRRAALRLGLAGASALALGAGAPAPVQAQTGRMILSSGSAGGANGNIGGVNASVERVHIPRGAPELEAHLFVNAAIHHTARMGAGHVDVGVRVTLLYTSGGRLVSLKSAPTDPGALDAKEVDSQTVRVVVKVPYGALEPDPGTAFVGYAQLFTRLPNNVEVPF